MTTTVQLPAPAAFTLPRAARYVIAGGIAGMVLAIIATFVIALFDGQAQGMSAGSCVVYGCALTLLLSQAVGFSGMFAGAGVGALVGGAAYLFRHRTPASSS